VTDAVITVPAYFQRQPAPGHQGRRQDRRAQCASHHQRTHGRLSGLWPGQKSEEKIAVFDLGGGTFDISILEIGEGSLKSRPPTVTPTWAVRISTCGSSIIWPTSSRKIRASI
jgi:molecular chaperone DnaK